MWSGQCKNKSWRELQSHDLIHWMGQPYLNSGQLFNNQNSFGLLRALISVIKSTMGGPRGKTGGPDPPPPEKSQNIGFLSNTGPDPLKNYKAIIQC